MSKKAKIIWGIIISIIVLLIMAVHFKWIYFSFSYTKDPFDSLSSPSVQKFIGEDINNVKPTIDKLLEKYNQQDFDYIYEMFSEKVKEQYTKEQNAEILRKMYNLFGGFISYDLEKSKISVINNSRKGKQIIIKMPAKFEKFKNADITIGLVSNGDKDFMLYGFNFNFKP